VFHAAAMTAWWHDLEAGLEARRAAEALRQRPTIDSPCGRTVIARGPGNARRKLINWAGNDYFGLVRHTSVVNAAQRGARQFGAGSGSARLLAGGQHIHRRVEERFARWQGYANALLVSSGFSAAQAMIGALLDGGRQDCLIVDRLAHACAIDGGRLAGVRLRRFKHNDVDDLRRQLAAASGSRRIMVIVESVYSMDGDLAPLAALAEVCAEAQALFVVDEAHGLGLAGSAQLPGAGFAAAQGVRPDIVMATGGKVLGSQGGLVAAATPIIETIVNAGRAFIFSTAPVPAASAALARSMQLVQTNDVWRVRLRDRVLWLRERLCQQGWAVRDDPTPIIPLLLGDDHQAVSAAGFLRQQGHFIPAIRPPTVPPGSSRLRLSISLAHTSSDCKRLLADLAALRAAHPEVCQKSLRAQPSDVAAPCLDEAAVEESNDRSDQAPDQASHAAPDQAPAQRGSA
jgi:8-amino-7-oxononanoate synthase